MSKFCPNCGTELNEGQDVCIKCGKALNIPAQPQSQATSDSKSKIAAGVLGLLLGTVGVHNFYLGYTGKGIAQLLLTVIGWIIIIGPIISGIWAFVEAIMIFTGAINKDADGKPLVN